MPQTSQNGFKSIGEMLFANRLASKRVIDFDLNVHCNGSSGLTDNDIKATRDLLVSALADPLRNKIAELEEADPTRPVGLLLHINGLSPSQHPASADRLFDAVKAALTEARVLKPGVTFLTDWGTRSDLSLSTVSELAAPARGTIAAARYCMRAAKAESPSAPPAVMKPGLEGLSSHLNDCLNAGAVCNPGFISETIAGIIDTAGAAQLDILANTLLRTAGGLRSPETGTFTLEAMPLLENAEWVARVRFLKFGPPG